MSHHHATSNYYVLNCGGTHSLILLYRMFAVICTPPDQSRANHAKSGTASVPPHKGLKGHISHSLNFILCYCADRPPESSRFQENNRPRPGTRSLSFPRRHCARSRLSNPAPRPVLFYQVPMSLLLRCAGAKCPVAHEADQPNIPRGICVTTKTLSCVRSIGCHSSSHPGSCAHVRSRVSGYDLSRSSFSGPRPF